MRGAVQFDGILGRLFLSGVGCIWYSFVVWATCFVPDDQMTRQTTILLVDDHPILRSGIRALLGGEGSLRVVGEASNGRVAVELARELRPDVVVMDVCMPDLNGVDATRRVLEDRPETKVVALSARCDERTAKEMLSAGAMGFIGKDAVYEDLVAAIEAVVGGRVYIHLPNVSQRGGEGQDIGSKPSAYERLSMREREILQLIAEGRATKEVAHILKVSLKTAETHRRNIMEKLQLDTVAALTKFAIREGLTTVDA